MIAPIQLQEDIVTCHRRLVQYASHDSRVRIKIHESEENSGELTFEMERRDSVFKAVSPIWRGMLSPQQDSTLLNGEFYGREFGIFFISMWCASVAFMSGVGIAARSIISLRADAQGYVSESGGPLVGLLVLPIFGLFMIWIAHSSQQNDRQEILRKLALCFDFPLDDAKIETWIKGKRVLKTGPLLGIVIGTVGAGIILGVFFGLIADIEDNLPPLKIAVTEMNICAVSDENSRPISQKVFLPHQDVYLCGHLKIEKVDHRKIEVPLIVTWHFKSGDREVGVIEYVLEKDGPFSALLEKPDSGEYRPGQYSVSISRNKAHLGERSFEVIDD